MRNLGSKYLAHLVHRHKLSRPTRLADQKYVYGCVFGNILSQDAPGLVLAKGARDIHSGSCTLGDGATSGLPILAAVLAIDLTLLSLILIGLFRRQESRTLGLGKMLWKQGIVWIVVASLLRSLQL